VYPASGSQPGLTRRRPGEPRGGRPPPHGAPSGTPPPVHCPTSGTAASRETEAASCTGHPGSVRQAPSMRGAAGILGRQPTSRYGERPVPKARREGRPELAAELSLSTHPDTCRHSAPPERTPALARSSERRRVAASDARSGRLAVVTDDDVRSLAITAGSEREPIVGRRAPYSSRRERVWRRSRRSHLGRGTRARRPASRVPPIHNLHRWRPRRAGLSGSGDGGVRAASCAGSTERRGGTTHVFCRRTRSSGSKPELPRSPAPAVELGRVIATRRRTKNVPKGCGGWSQMVTVRWTSAQARSSTTIWRSSRMRPACWPGLVSLPLCGSGVG